ncbi:MAG: hypothetical protein C4523_11760 [Myxococcales bacterium]|nr:MAG: hypothetical protein C4523_11760 [Myxococcales bacterium]
MRVESALTRKAAILAGMFLALTLFVAPAARAASIGAAEIAAYTRLAEQIPSQAPLVVMAAGLSQTAASIEALFKRYQQTDPTFDYNKLTLSLKGGLGYNPLSTSELATLGLDLDYGLAVYSLSRDGAPLVVGRMSNRDALKKMLDTMAVSVGQGKALPPAKEKDAEIFVYTQDGTPAGKLQFIYALKGESAFVMAQPPSREWFDKHLAASLGLAKAKSLAADKTFAALLKRLEAKTSFVSYSNYAQYMKELKQTARSYEKELAGKGGFTDIPSPVELMDEFASFAEGFSGQIFAVSIQSERVRFVHELIGPKAKVQEWRKFFPGGGASKLAAINLLGDSIGSLYGTIDFKAIKDYFARKIPAFDKNWQAWNARVKQEANLDMDAEILAALGVEFAAAFYGLGPLPEAITKATSVSEAQMTSLAKLVIAASLRDPAKAKELMKKAELGILTNGKIPGMFSAPTGDRFLEVVSDGLPLQFGVYKDVFLIGIGTRTLQDFVAKASAGGTTLDPKTVGRFAFDVGKLAATMENLKPPADSPNTQLHQQYKVWHSEVASKLSFIKRIEAQATQIADGFRSTGEFVF